MENSQQMSRETAATVQSYIKASGFVPNDQKSVWEPTQIICWLGLQWNGVLGTIAISPQHIETLFADLNDIINQEIVSARTLARVVGRDHFYRPRHRESRMYYVETLPDVDC